MYEHRLTLPAATGELESIGATIKVCDGGAVKIGLPIYDSHGDAITLYAYDYQGGIFVSDSGEAHWEISCRHTDDQGIEEEFERISILAATMDIHRRGKELTVIIYKCIEFRRQLLFAIADITFLVLLAGRPS